MSERPSWSVYVLRCADGRLYTGIATDVARRIGEHAAGRGAKSLRGRGPFEVALRMEIGARGPALRVEQRIKRLARADKERLLRSATRRRALLADAGVTLTDKERRARPAAGARSRPRPTRPAR